METTANDYAPLEYDADRLRRFYTRAASAKNLSRRYSPGRDEVDLGMFADAMIGLYLEASGEKAHIDQQLARVAFAIEYLQGVPYEELDKQLRDEPRARKMGVNEYALGIAGEAGRHFRTTMAVEESLGAGFNHQIESIDAFVDLGDTIKRLFQDDQISSGVAQSLLLLFRQSTSNAPEDLQLRLVRDMKLDLHRRLNATIGLLPHDGNQLVDQTFAKGASYVREVLRTTLSEATMNALIMREAGRGYAVARNDEYRDQVLGHMGYVVDKVYRRNQVR